MAIIHPIIILSFCAAVYLLSWQFYQKHNWGWALALLMLGGLVLRLYTASDYFLHPWDERYHALVAKNLIRLPHIPILYTNPVLPYQYTDWTSNHIWLHKQPLPLWAMACSLYLFGVNEIALRLPSIILSTIGIGLLYAIAQYFYNNKVAYLAAFFYSINGLIIELAAGRVATDHIDIYFLFFVECAICFCIVFAKNKKLIFNILAGLCIGAAVLSKWLPALIVLPIWYLIISHQGGFTAKQKLYHFLYLISITLLTCMPWQLFIFYHWPLEAAYEQQLHHRHFTNIIEQQAGPFYYYLNKIRINYGELIYLPLAWFLWQIKVNVTSKKNWAIALWIFVPLLFFSLAKTKMQGYILFIAPALFMVTAAFFYQLYYFFNNKNYKSIGVIVCLAFILLPIRYTIERMKPFENHTISPAWARDLRQLNHKYANNALLFNYERPIEAMFYTNLTAYACLPTAKQIMQLQAQGYTIILNNNATLPLELQKLKGIHLENIAAY